MSAALRPLLRRARRVVAVPSLVAVSALVAFAAPALAAQPPVGLGTATSFAVLAGSGITNTGPTTITGDVGTFPTPTETGMASVTLTGTDHAGDAVTQSAKSSLVTAYDDAAGRTPATNVPVELGGTTLAPGVYTSPTFGLTGTLTLDAGGDPDAQFVFLAGSTLIAEANSNVLLQNGASPCRIVWQVGSSATFKTGAAFVGDVLALTSITAQTAASFDGRLLARNGAVTLDTNTIRLGACATTSGGSGTGGSSAIGGTGGTSDGIDGTDGVDGTGGGADGTTADGGAGTTTGDGTFEGTSSSTGRGAGSGPPRSLAFTGGTTDRLIVLALGLILVGAIVSVLGSQKNRRPRLPPRW